MPYLLTTESRDSDVHDIVRKNIFIGREFLSMTNNIISRSIVVSALAAGLSIPLMAESAQAQQASQPKWGKICSKAGENDICNVQYTLVTRQGQMITSVNLLTSKGQVNRRIFQVAVPTGRAIPPGIKMKIDKGKENTLPYGICLPDRCIAEIPLTDGLVKALKGGGNISLTSTNFRAQKNPVNVTLKGFTAAFDGPPLKRSEVEDRQKKLAEELKKKADETRKKLKEAQEKAKSDN